MLDFGKHAFFVWASYGLSAAVLGALVIYTLANKPKDQ